MASRRRKAPKNIKKHLADPALRALLADNLLTPELLAKRKANRHNLAPAGPGSQITNQAMSDLLRTATDDRFRDTDRTLADNKRTLDFRGAQVPVYFQQYQAELARIQGGQQQREQQALATASQAPGQAVAAQQAAMSPVLAQQAQDAAQRGATLDPNLAMQQGAAAAVTGQNVESQVALLRNLSGINNDFLTNQGLVARGYEAEARTGQQQAMDALARDIVGVSEDKGRFREQTRQSVLGDEQKALMDAALAASIMGDRGSDNERADKALTLSETKANRSASQWSSTPNKYGVTNGAWKDWGNTPAGKAKRAAAIKEYNANKGGKKTEKEKTYEQRFFDKYKVKPANQGAVAKAQDSIEKGKSVLSTILGWKKGEKVDPADKNDDAEKHQFSGADLDWNGMYKQLVDNGVGPLSARVAADQHFLDGFISNGTASKLHKAGYSVKGLGLKTVVKGPDSLNKKTNG